MGRAADRRLWLNADKSQVLEDGDPDAAFLFATPGSMIEDGDWEHYGLTASEDGKVQLRGAQKAPDKPKSVPKVQNKMVAKGEDK